MLADRISIVRKGRIVESGSLAELRHLGRTTLTVATSQSIAGIAAMEGVHDLHPEGGKTILNVDAAHLPEVMRELARRDIHSITATPPTLEQLLLRHYGDELNSHRS